MRSWHRWWKREKKSEAQVVPVARAPAEAPPELLDLLKKTARAQARLAARLDDVEQSLATAIAELRGTLLTQLQPRAAATPAESSDANDLLDALDKLDFVADALDVGEEVEGLADGLRAVSYKLEASLARRSIERVGTPGMEVNGRFMKVVATECRDDLPDGVVTRVVRAAALVGERVIREGEVFANRRGEMT
jgi:molecular chaperone GrpE (heat shock protein)